MTLANVILSATAAGVDEGVPGQGRGLAPFPPTEDTADPA